MIQKIIALLILSLIFDIIFEWLSTGSKFFFTLREKLSKLKNRLVYKGLYITSALIVALLIDYIFGLHYIGFGLMGAIAYSLVNVIYVEKYYLK